MIRVDSGENNQTSTPCIRKLLSVFEMKFLRGRAPSTVFHITHWKAGSQWILKILEDLQPDRIVSPRVGEGQFFVDKLIEGKIYPTTYLHRKTRRH
jgi:hypothetical protein